MHEEAGGFGAVVPYTVVAAVLRHRGSPRDEDEDEDEDEDDDSRKEKKEKRRRGEERSRKKKIIQHPHGRWGKTW